jgi:hypothetical protein
MGDDEIKFPEKGWFQSWWYTYPNGEIFMACFVGGCIGLIFAKIFLGG